MEKIKKYLKDKGIFNLERDKQLVSVCQLVSRIPFGEGRTIEEVLTTKKVGTCTGKHLLLQACLKQLGINYQPVVCTFRWSEQGIKFPPNLLDIFRKGEWKHGHNFVQVQKEDGTKIDIDITWNPALKQYGFKTLPENWDANSSFIGLNKIIDRWEEESIEKIKKELINSLPPEKKERREKFLKELFQWINRLRHDKR